MEGREQAREREDSLHFDLKQKRSRHNDFRSSIFSTPTKERSTSFSRGLAAAAAGPPSFLAAMSGHPRNPSEDDTLAEGGNADPDAVRAAMDTDASSQGSIRELGGGGGIGGAGCGEAASGEEVGLGGAEPGADGGGRYGGADSTTTIHCRGKHWSSAAAACVLGGHPPSPRAAAAVAARAADARGGERGHDRRNGSGGGGGGGGSGGGIVSYGGGAAAHIIAGRVARAGNGDVDGGAAAAAAHAGQGIAAAAAAAAAATADAVVAAPAPEKEGRKPPRPKSVWERGGAAPPRKTVWRQLIDPPKGEGMGGGDVDGGTRSSRWNRSSTGATGGESGLQGGGAVGDGDRRSRSPGRAEDPSASIQGRGGGCLSCCRKGGDGCSGGGGDKETTRGRLLCCRPLWCKSQRSSSSSGGGGGGDIGGARPAITNQDRRRRRRHPSGSGWNSDNANLGGGRSGGSGIKASGVFLAVGLILEVAASLWAFRQAAQAGALTGDADGTAGVAITALAVALSGEAVEAAAGVIGLKNTSRSGGGSSALLAGAAAVEAVAVVAVAAVLMLFLPSFASASAATAAAEDDDDGSNTDTSTTHDAAEAWPVWAAVAAAIVGALVEAIPAGFDRAAERLPFLGAFGHAVLWIGVAALEVLVAAFLVRDAREEGSATATAAAGQRIALAAVLEDREMVGLVVVEAIALVAVWVARGLWTRARLLLAVKGLEGPSRRWSSQFVRCDSV